MLQMDLRFPHSYEIREIRELPGAGAWDIPIVYFPRPANRPEQDGTWIELHPLNGKPWIGVFAFGGSSFSTIASSPHPDRICIISNGAGYFVNVKDPEDWQLLPVLPVADLRFVPDRSLLIFGDFTRLCAYGKSGLIWRSPRLCWDELKILRVKEDRIEGVGYDPANGGYSPFIADLETGQSLIPAPVTVDGRPFWQ